MLLSQMLLIVQANAKYLCMERSFYHLMCVIAFLLSILIAVTESISQKINSQCLQIIIQNLTPQELDKLWNLRNLNFGLCLKTKSTPEQLALFPKGLTPCSFLMIKSRTLTPARSLLDSSYATYWLWHLRLSESCVFICTVEIILPISEALCEDYLIKTNSLLRGTQYIISHSRYSTMNLK